MKKVVFANEEYLALSWEEMENFCFTLTQKIERDNFDQIVAISRGGLVVGRILADFLNLPISLFTIQAYKEIGKQNIPKITEKLNAKVSNKKVLLVDEIVDTGNTLSLALSYLRKPKPLKIKVAVLFYKQKSKIVPDYFLFKTSAWVIFPYEVRETIEKLYQRWKKSKKPLSNQEMKERLKKLGFSEIYIEAYWPKK